MPAPVARIRPPAESTAGVNPDMSQLTHTRRRLISAVLAISALLGASPLLSPAPASATQQTRDARVLSTRICDYEWQSGRRQVKLLIRCAARRWSVSGGPNKALQVARCESGYNPDAYNPDGYAGVFQQAQRYWPSRADHWGFPDRSAFNGRANIIVSIRMAHASGWGGWGCA
jgi:Transglycosylase-like domain